MKIKDRILYLKEYHFNIWSRTKQETENEISDGQSLKCVCGKLATGLHESYCKRFKDKVERETAKKLKYLNK